MKCKLLGLALIMSLMALHPAYALCVSSNPQAEMTTSATDAYGVRALGKCVRTSVELGVDPCGCDVTCSGNFTLPTGKSTAELLTELLVQLTQEGLSIKVKSCS